MCNTFGFFDIQIDLLPRGENYQSADLKIIGILRRVPSLTYSRLVSLKAMTSLSSNVSPIGARDSSIYKILFPTAKQKSTLSLVAADVVGRDPSCLRQGSGSLC